MKCKTKIFVDKKGNRFLFPSLICSDHELSPSMSDVIFQSMGISVAHGSELKTEDDWFEFDDTNIPHVKIDVTSSAFLHGYATAYAISGPLFDEVKNELR